MTRKILNINKVWERWVIGLSLIISPLSFGSVAAQDKIIDPDISYAGTARSCTIGGISVSGVEGYEDYVLTGLSGLTIGQQIEIPGTQITEAVKRYWRNGLFSKVKISALHHAEFRLQILTL